MGRRPFLRRTVQAAVVALALLPAGCGFFSPTISVDRVGPEDVYTQLNRNALNSSQVSTATGTVLHRLGLKELEASDRWAALKALHAEAVREPIRENLFALAELAYHHGRKRDAPDAYLTAAVYAWLYLLGEEDPEPPNPYDRRFRWACDLYNSGLQRGFEKVDGECLDIGPSVRELPVGTLTIDLDTTGTHWTEEEYDRYVAGDEFLVEGLSLRMRDSGLGVPLIGLRADGTRGAVPATAFLRMHGGLAELEGGASATVELYSSYDAKMLAVKDNAIPLESDLSVELAYSLNDSPVWKFSLAGLFEGERAVRENKLHPMRALERGRVPVVFVHGTASNPAYWAEMFNTLLGDPVLRENMQFLFFQYASGNPISYSAYTLRKQLTEQLSALDPEGADEALQNAVLVGHSQGGLLVRMQICDGNIRWIEEVTGKPIEEFDLTEAQDELIRGAVDFRAVPQVTRAVFLSTPHRGSFMAAKWYTRWAAKFISLPGQLQGLMSNMVKESGPSLPPAMRERLPTALDNMDPSSPMLKRLSQAPISKDVSMHSIIAIGDADKDEPGAVVAADDGVVKYIAAWMPGVESELLVNDSHSCQENPLVIQEVRRILHAHLRALAGDGE
jgi:hypothetical protein